MKDTQHGGDAPAIARNLGLAPGELLDLSASLNPFAPDVTALAANHLSALVPYPDDGPATERLASEFGVDARRLVLCNGGAQAIALLGAVLKQGEVRQPEFSLYQRHLDTVGHGLGRWRSNPSNPLGDLADTDEEAVVWDEAFYPLATGQWTRGDSESWRIGSLTKIWACAGLRLGYVIAPTDQGADQIRSIQPRWSVNGLALALINDLLDQTDLPEWSSRITQLGSELANDLVELGYKARSTAANWVLVENEQDLRNELIQKRVLIRDCTSFGLPGLFRIALPKPGEVDRVVSAFETCSVR